MAQQGSGYDISASSSDASTQGGATGAINVGGGIKLPPWLLAVAIAGAVIVLLSWFGSKKK